MKYYLLMYDREIKKLSKEPKEYSSDERKTAWSDRFKLELEYKDKNHIEVVLFGAKSLADLKKTHGRYFFDYKKDNLRESVQKLKRSLKKI